jgi:hypothetical protein
MERHGKERTPLGLLLRNVRCFEASVAQLFLHVVNTPQYNIARTRWQWPEGRPEGACGDTQSFIRTRYSIQPSIADEIKHEIKKALMQKQCVFTARCHVADLCNMLAKVWPPLSCFFTETVATIRVRELSDATSYLTELRRKIQVQR